MATEVSNYKFKLDQAASMSNSVISLLRQTHKYSIKAQSCIFEACIDTLKAISVQRLDGSVRFWDEVKL